MGDQSAPEQGPRVTTLRIGKQDMRWFNRIMDELQTWRSDDHEDAKTLHRNEIIEIIEGVKALRREP